MQEGKLNLEIYLCWNSLDVQRLFEGYYEEVSTMAFFSACFYSQFMCEAKYAARAPLNLLLAIQRTDGLKQFMPIVSRAGLEQRERHLCYLCPEQAVFGIFDDRICDEEKRAVVDALMSYIHQWQPGEILIDAVSDKKSKQTLMHTDFFPARQGLPASVTAFPPVMAHCLA